MKPRLQIKAYRNIPTWFDRPKKRYMWIVRWPDGTVESDVGYNRSETAYRDGYCVAIARNTANA